jgi:hypothetical protein
LVPLLNFFMPAMKLESRVKAVSKETKKYDALRSPYQRLWESEALPPEVKAELPRLCGLYKGVPGLGGEGGLGGVEVAAETGILAAGKPPSTGVCPLTVENPAEPCFSPQILARSPPSPG